MSQSSETAPAVGTSSLGGAREIAARFQAFQQAEAAPESTKEAPETKAEPKEAAKGTETKQEASSGGKGDGILPAEKTPQKAPESKAEAKGSPDKKEVQSTEKAGPDGLTKEQRSDLVKVKERAEALEARSKELEAKLADHEITKKEVDELRRIRTELEEKSKVYEAKATAFDVSSSPHFQKTIIAPLKTLSQGMESLCETNKLDADAVFAAIKNPDEASGNAALSEFLANLDTFTSNKFQRIVNDMRDLERKGQELIEKAPEAWTAIQTEMNKKAEEDKIKSKETMGLAHKAVHSAMKERFSFVSDEVLKDAQAIELSSLSPDKQAYYIQAGLAALEFNNVLKAKDAEIESLKAAIKKDLPPGTRDGDSETVTRETKQRDMDDEKYNNLTTGQRLQLEFGQQNRR